MKRQEKTGNQSKCEGSTDVIESLQASPADLLALLTQGRAGRQEEDNSSGGKATLQMQLISPTSFSACGEPYERKVDPETPSAQDNKRDNEEGTKSKASFVSDEEGRVESLSAGQEMCDR